MNSKHRWLAAAVLAASAAAAFAAETITYTYDARGRLVQVVRTGTANNGVTTTYTIDKADNPTIRPARSRPMRALAMLMRGPGISTRTSPAPPTASIN